MEFTQIPTDTFKQLQLNAGILCKNFDPSTRQVIDIIGATSGGVNFTATPAFIDFGEDIVMLNFEYDWKQIARRLKEMTVRQEHIFSQWPLKEQKLPVAEDKDTTSMKRGRKR